MSKWRYTKEQIEKKLENLRKRLRQLETMEKQGKVFWSHIETEDYDREAKSRFYEKRAIESKIIDLECRLKHGFYKEISY